MRKKCKLIATLPSLANLNKIVKVFAEPNVSEVRFNTGVRSPFTTNETVNRLYNLARSYHKKLWIDLKGRQLRVNVWADPRYECVELNHSIAVKLPARITFRNGTSSLITNVDGNRLFLSEPPREALGKGQSVNISGENFHITDGYLTLLDKEYISALKNIPLTDVYIMASFVESEEDLNEIAKILNDSEHKATYCAKIESQKGVDFAISQNYSTPCRYMAARDDLFIELGRDYSKTKKALQIIAMRDKSAICASRIFTSLDKFDTPSLADFEDLDMMYRIGYHEFMLDDNICNYAFEKAIKAWEGFKDA